MQKEELKLNQKDRVTEIQHYDVEDETKIAFRVVNYMPIAVQFILANTYLDAYFNSAIENIEEMFISKWDYIGAENALMIAVMDNLTSIPVIDNDGKMLVDVDDIVHNGVWDSIKSEIENYEEFRRCLDVMTEDAKREILSSRSVGSVIDSLANKAMLFVNSLAELDLSEKGVKQIMDSIGNLSEQLEDSPIGGLLEEAKSGKAKSSKKETT